MKKGEFIELLKLRCGKRKDSDFEAVVNLEATLAQENDLEANGQIYPWFLESEWAEASLIANEERIPLPIEFLAEIEGQVFQVQINGEWIDLEKKRYDEMIKEYGNASVGIPQAYDLSGEYFVFRPIPNEVVKVRMRFMKRDIPFNQLTNAQENKWLVHASDWLLAATGRVIAAEHLHDDTLTDKFSTQLSEARNRVFSITEAREHANRTYRMEA